MNKQKVKTLRALINTALKTIEADQGVVIEIGHASYTSDSVKFQFDVIDNVSDDGTSMGFLELSFKRDCHVFGFKAEDFGKQFTSNGATFTICGLKPGNRKYPVIGINKSGAKFKFRAEAVQSKLIDAAA